MRSIEKAKTNGFWVTMNYIGVDTPEIAQERVSIRVAKGGHGIDPKTLTKRYYQSFKHLEKAIYLCNEINIYDNTKEMTQIMYIKDGEISWCSDNLPKWIENIDLKKNNSCDKG